MNNVIKGIKLILSGLLSPFTIVINGVKELMYVGSRVQHIEDNLMYDTTPDEINKSISFIKEQIDGLIKTVHTNKYDIKELENGAKVLVDCVEAGKSLESDISSIKKRIIKLENETETHMNCFNGSESSHLLYLINELEEYHKPSGIEMYRDHHPEVILERIKNLNKDITTWMNFAVDSKEQVDNDINEIQLSLESMKPKDLGTFNFIGYEPTQLEQDMIEAEAKGELVVKELRDEGYDWARERRLKDKQIQDRMRKDEANFLND